MTKFRREINHTMLAKRYDRYSYLRIGNLRADNPR